MIELKHISKKYKRPVLEDVSFYIEKGSMTGLVGINGSGKTTLLSIMTGNVKPDQGEIWYNGKNTKANKKTFKREIGYVPQENPLIPELSVKDNLKLWYFDRKRRKNLDRMLAMFRFEGELNKKTAILSGGMKKRLSIICAMADQPSVLLLDEPTAALDLVAKKDLLTCLSAFTQNGGTVFMTSHEETEFEWFDQIYGISHRHVIKFPKDITREQIISQLRKDANV